MLGVSFAQYEVGQIWQYKTREGEETSHIYIAQIDTMNNYGNIYHIYIDGLTLKNPYSATGYQSVLPHAPVDKEALDASVIELLKSDAEMPDISEGYSYWREAFDSGQAGVFTAPIDQIIQFIEEASNQKP